MEHNNTFWKNLTGRWSYFVLLLILLFEVIVLRVQHQYLFPTKTEDGYPIIYYKEEPVIIKKPLWKAIDDDRKK